MAMSRSDMLLELMDVVNISPARPAIRVDLLYSWLSEGQRKFCESTGFFTDFTNFTLTTVASTATYAIDERIIEIYGIYDAVGGFWLGKNDEESLLPAGSLDCFPRYIGTASSGQAGFYQLDRSSSSILLTPTPNTVRTLTLKVWRYPLWAITDSFTAPATGEPTIPDIYRRACIEYAAGKAFSLHDMEMQDPVKARDHMGAFREICLDGLAAFRRSHGIQATIGTVPGYRT